MCILEKIKKQLALLITVIALISLNGCNKEEVEKDENSYQVALEYDEVSGDVTVDPVMQSYPKNTMVKLTANPKTGYKFLGWKSNGVIISTQKEISFNVDEDVDIMAYFESDDASTSGETFFLDVSYDPMKGDVEISPDKFKYDDNESVTITATPREGYKFKEWQGISGSSNVLNIEITDDMDITAIFEKAENVIVTTSDIIFEFEGKYIEENGNWKFTASLENDSKSIMDADKYITKAVIKINGVQMDMEGVHYSTAFKGNYYNLEMENLGPDEVLSISVKHEAIDFAKSIKTPSYFTDENNLEVKVDDPDVVMDWQALECKQYMVYKSIDYSGGYISGNITFLPISENHFETSTTSLLYRDFNDKYISSDRVCAWIVPVKYVEQLDGFHEDSSIMLDGKKGNVRVWKKK